MGWRAVVQHALRRGGYEVTRYPILRFLRQHEVNVVLDVGANVGQYASELRELGFDGRIVSFEPLSSAYDELARRAAPDPRWQPVRLALGREAGQNKIHVAGNSASSSILEMLPRHNEVAPHASYVGEEVVPVERLDAVWSEYCSPADRVFLKIDTQGYERQVLEGAQGVMPQVVGLQLELSLVHLYEGQPLAEEVIALARSLGFIPTWFGAGLKDPATQQLLQVDGLFFRPHELAPE